MTSFMKLSPTTKSAVAASMAAMPLRSELLLHGRSVDQGTRYCQNTTMDTIADDGFCRTASCNCDADTYEQGMTL